MRLPQRPSEIVDLLDQPRLTAGRLARAGAMRQPLTAAGEEPNSARSAALTPCLPALNTMHNNFPAPDSNPATS